MTTVILEFDKLLRLVQRQSNAAEPLPPFFVKTLQSLEHSLSTALAKEKEAKKKMNATNARALNSMKQKVRKTTKEFEKEVRQYQDVRHFKFLYLSQSLLLAGSGVIRTRICRPCTTCRRRDPETEETEEGRRN
jgi:hypothetical protein